MIDVMCKKLCSKINNTVIKNEILSLILLQKEENPSPTKRSYKLSSVIPVGVPSLHFQANQQSIDWTDTLEWGALHLAVKYDIKCLEVGWHTNTVLMIKVLMATANTL